MPSPRSRGVGDYGYESGITLLVLDRAAIQRFYEPGGSVYRWARDIAREIEAVAKASLVEGHGYRTGELQRSVGSSVTPTAGSLVANVRATSRHALLYHDGMDGDHYYLIEASTPGGRLVFFDRRIGKIVKRHYVWHPPQVAHPFLRDAMEEVLAAHRIA